MAHTSSKCPSGTCRTCSRKHNTLFHIPELPDNCRTSDGAREGAGSSVSASTGNPDAVVAHTSNTIGTGCILLSTAVAFAQNKINWLQSCRVLLDLGPQANFISRNFLSTLGLSTPCSVNIAITGINGTVTCSTQAVQLKL